MPGKDEKKEQEFNEFYFNMMKGADEYIAGARFGTIPSRIPEIEKKNKENALNNIATAIAYAQVAMRYGKGEEPDNYLELLDQAKQNASKIRKNREFREKFESMSVGQLRGLLSKERDKDGKENISYDELAKRVSDREKTPEGRMNILVYQLEQSTQKSIFGKIKSIFTGNSQQYKNALGAMKALSEGKVNQEKMGAAKKAIKDYILARGDKVRDHQYGRDRFDAFMKGLGEIMTPQEFVGLCRDVNSARREYYGRDTDRTVDPVEYMATDEKKEIMRAAWEADYSLERREERKATIDYLADRKEQEEARKEKEQKKAQEEHERKEAEQENNGIKKDEERIRNDTKVKDIKGEQTGMNLMERCQKDLDRLRRYTADQMLLDDVGKGIRKSISNRLFMHPAFRVVAEPIIKEKGMQELFKYPPVRRDEMNPDVVKQLDAQVKELKELDLKIQQDQKKQQDLNNKPVEVGGPQPGGGMVL